MTATKHIKAKTTKAKHTAPQSNSAPVSVPDGNRWHMLYTPAWRAQLDYGVESTLTLATATIEANINDTVSQSWEWRSSHGAKERPVVVLNWEQVSEAQWQASGNDGLLETTLPIATLTRVG